MNKLLVSLMIKDGISGSCASRSDDVDRETRKASFIYADALMIYPEQSASAMEAEGEPAEADAVAAGAFGRLGGAAKRPRQ